MKYSDLQTHSMSLREENALRNALGYELFEEIHGVHEDNIDYSVAHDCYYNKETGELYEDD